MPSVINLFATMQTVYALDECVYSVVSISWYTAEMDFPKAYLDSFPGNYSCINSVNSFLTLFSQTAAQSRRNYAVWIIVMLKVQFSLWKTEARDQRYVITDLEILSCFFLQFCKKSLNSACYMIFIFFLFL